MQTYPCRPWEYPVKSGKFPSSFGKSFEPRPKPCGTAKLCCGQLQICHLLTADFDVRRFDCKVLCSASLRLKATFESVHRQPEAWRFPRTRQTDKANFNSLKQIRQIKEMQIIADTDSYAQLWSIMHHWHRQNFGSWKIWNSGLFSCHCAGHQVNCGWKSELPPLMQGTGESERRQPS